MKVTGVGVVSPSPDPEEVSLDRRTLLLRRAVVPPTIPAREARRLTRTALLALAACKDALGDASVEGTGIALGSGFGSVEATRLALEGLFERADLVSPSHFVASVRHDAAGTVARLLGLRGPSVATSARRLSFEQALGWALVQLRRGRTRAVVVAGADEVTPVLARALARGRLHRELIVWGEGAGALLLESERSERPALARIERFVEGAGTVDELVEAIRRSCGAAFDLVLTDEDGSARRARAAERVAAAFSCEKRAPRCGHLSSGGALVAVEAVREGKGRVLCYAREADGPFCAYVVERP